MTLPRQSKRSSAVKKRKELEGKLERRKQRLALFRLKYKSQTSKNNSQSEAVEGSGVDEHDDNADLSDVSLEWDNSEENPSFLTASSSSVSSAVLDQIIADIDELGGSPWDQEVHSGVQEPRRKLTETDHNILEGSVGEKVKKGAVETWPPRALSSEPDDLIFSPILPSTNEGLSVVDEVFEEVSAMDENAFKQRLKPLSVAKRKVESSIKKFEAKDVTVADLPTYRDNLKDIRDKSDSFEELLFELLEDLDSENLVDSERLKTLTTWQEQVTEAVVKNETEVKNKVVSLQDSKPLSEAEKKAKENKQQKLGIDLESFKTKCETLYASISLIKDSKDLSDQDVKQYLLDCKTWESKIESIEALKVAIDKESIEIDVDQSKLKIIQSSFEKLQTVFKSKKEDLSKADSERCLYSLCKGVKELAIYPDVFSGKESEDIFDFKEKMLDALRTNQIREKDKITVLRKYLKGEAKDMIGQHYEKFDDAIDALMDHFGLAQKTWEFKLRILSINAKNLMFGELWVHDLGKF